MDFTFLKKDQIWGDSALDVIKKYGTKVAPTDLVVVLGAYMKEGYGCRTSEGDLTCSTWSSSFHRSIQYNDTGDEDFHVKRVCCVDRAGEEDLRNESCLSISTRPALPPSVTSKISPSKVRVVNGIRIATYEELSQTKKRKIKRK